MSETKLKPECNVDIDKCRYAPPAYDGDCMFLSGRRCNHKEHIRDYRASAFMAQAAQITRLESELAEAREALRKADEAIVEYHTEYDAISKWYSCIFCSDAQSEPEDIEHTGDCPVTTARARLAPG